MEQKQVNSRYSGANEAYLTDSFSDCSCNHKQNYQKIVNNGIYYYPAWKHYGRVTTVVCDRCSKSGLKTCIGFGQSDLCMICVEELTRNTHKCMCHHCNSGNFVDNDVGYFA